MPAEPARGGHVDLCSEWRMEKKAKRRKDGSSKPSQCNWEMQQWKPSALFAPILPKACPGRGVSGITEKPPDDL